MLGTQQKMTAREPANQTLQLLTGEPTLTETRTSSGAVSEARAQPSERVRSTLGMSSRSPTRDASRQQQSAPRCPARGPGPAHAKEMTAFTCCCCHGCTLCHHSWAIMSDLLFSRVQSLPLSYITSSQPPSAILAKDRKPYCFHTSAFL